MGKYADAVYLSTTWNEDRGVVIRNHKLKMVTSRSEHPCYGNNLGEEHTIPKGSRALYESCIYDGEWVTRWLCTDCMDAWLDDVDPTALRAPESGGGTDG